MKLAETSVVNLRKSKYDVYIGRQGKGLSGVFGNPVKVNEKCFVCGSVHTTGGSTLECYEVYLLIRLEEDNEFKEAFLNLKGKTLGCFCKPLPCHGDVIVKIIESL
jgi:hypothetical protein